MGEDQIIGRQNLRPDLIVSKRNDIIIFDITVPLDNGLEAFEVARRAKVEKYKELAEELSTERVKAVGETIVVGALGSCVPENDKPLRRICVKKYIKLMKKIVVSEIIAF